MTRSRFPRSDYEALSPYDPGRSPIALDLSDNTNLWGPHPAALEIVREAEDQALSRYPSVYGKDLKEAVVAKFGVGMENVTTGCGSDDLLDSVFRAAVEPPGRMSYPDPTFSMVQVFARMNGLLGTAIPWVAAEADPGALLAKEPDLVYVCRPNNPTGASAPKEWVLELLRRGGPEGPIVVLDEAYADFADDDLVEEATQSHRLLVLRTFSKLYGLAGLRVGFGIGPAPLIGEIEKARGPYKVNSLAEQAAAAALTDSGGWAAGIAAETVRNRERLRTELESRGLSSLPSQGNFLLIPMGSGQPDQWKGSTGFSAQELNHRLKESGVAARPFPNLDSTGDALRVSIGPWEDMVTFLGALDTALGETRPSK